MKERLEYRGDWGDPSVLWNDFLFTLPQSSRIALLSAGRSNWWYLPYLRFISCIYEEEHGMMLLHQQSHRELHID